MRIWRFLVAGALVPVAAFAAVSSSGGSLFARIPALPQTPQGAYGQWVDSGDSGLQEGPEFKNLQAALLAASTGGTPSAPQQKAAMAMAAQYNSPEGQAKLASMSLAEKMAFAQRMQASMGVGQPPAAGPVSDSDGALVHGLGAYPQTIALRQKIQALNQQRGALLVAWQKGDDAIGRDESAERAGLPLCPDEAGEPSGIALRAVALKYADKRIALAGQYLPKFEPIVEAYKSAVRPEVAYADSSVVKWEKIHNPGLKAQLQPAVDGSMRSAIADIGGAAGFVEEVSKEAAKRIAARKSMERLYAQAKGC